MPVCPLCQLHTDKELVPCSSLVRKVIEVDGICSTCADQLISATADFLRQAAEKIRKKS